MRLHGADRAWMGRLVVKADMESATTVACVTLFPRYSFLFTGACLLPGQPCNVGTDVCAAISQCRLRRRNVHTPSESPRNPIQGTVIHRPPPGIAVDAIPGVGGLHCRKGAVMMLPINARGAVSGSLALAQTAR